MNKKDKEEFVRLIAQALNEVMVPALESMETRLKDELASKKDLDEVRIRLSRVESKIDTLDRKFETQQNRLDQHNERIKKLEGIHPQGKHSLVTA